MSGGGGGAVRGEHAPTLALERERDEARAEGNRLLVSGTAIGAATVLSTVLLGATCPLCVVGVPAILAVGAVKRVQASRLSARLAAAARGEPSPATAGGPADAVPRGAVSSRSSRPGTSAAPPDPPPDLPRRTS